MISERLIFKKIRKEDKHRYINHVKSDSVMRYITGGGLPFEKALQRFEEARAMSKKHRKFGIFTVWEKTTNSYIGLARMKLDHDGAVEIGYNLLEAHWGKGFGSEIGNTLMSFLKKQNFQHDIYAIAELENTGSVKILEKLGLRNTGEKIDDLAYIFR